MTNFKRAMAIALPLLVVMTVAFFAGQSIDYILHAEATRTVHKDLMDNPIPPGLKQKPNQEPGDDSLPIIQRVPASTGYCVSLEVDGEFIGKVNVPLHKADLKKLPELRASLMTAVFRYADMLGQNAMFEPDAAKRFDMLRQNTVLMERLSKGVRFDWEVPPPTFSPVSPESSQPVPIGDTGGIVCTCATWYDPTVVGAKMGCSGPCGGCFRCGH